MPPDLNPHANIPAAGGIRCPLATDRHRECYCFEMSSSDIPDMQHFCGHNHGECRIYRTNLRAYA